MEGGAKRERRDPTDEENANNNNPASSSSLNAPASSSSLSHPPPLKRFRVRTHYFVPGDIVWTRPPGLPYWPAETTAVDDAANTVTAQLYDPPPLALLPSSCVTASSGKVFFFDRLATPEEVETCIEDRLQRASHDVSAYEANFHRAVLHANRLVRTVLSPDRLQPFSVCGIGVVHSLMRTHIAAPRQPHTGRFEPQTAVIRLRRGLENAVRDLRGFELIWVLFHFSYAVVDEPQRNPTVGQSTQMAQECVPRRQGAERAAGFKTMIVPPRDTELRGVFATRSPHRPNFIGLSCVRLVAVRGLDVHIADHDLLHGTPVLDIKPYLPFCDAHPGARAGWVEALDESGRGGADHKYDTQRLHVDRIFEDEASEAVRRAREE